MKRKLKDFLKRGGFRLGRFAERLGVHITPVHYYAPLPDLQELKQTRLQWARASDLPGIAVDLDQQAASLRETCTPFESEYRDNRAYQEGVEKRCGPGYGPIEAQALHAFVRSVKPKRIIEVGSGVSTHCMLEALRRNVEEGAAQANVTCIEPYPSSWLGQAKDISLIQKPVQQVSTEVFGELQSGDLLFIDSSHTVKPGSDVNFIVGEVLPRLRPGVFVHVHDIYLPYDYQREVLKTYFHASETSLLRAWLIGNSRVEIVFALSMLFYARPDVLLEAFPQFVPQAGRNGMLEDRIRPFEAPPGHFPSSIYLRTVEGDNSDSSIP